MTPLVTIFYDGRCHLCSREIGMFQRRVTDGRLGYVDISLPSFNSAEYGVDSQAVHKTMHVKMADGEIRTGVAALAAMWEQVPGFRWLARLTRVKLLKPFCYFGYVVFAWIRPKLPRRKALCETGACPTR